MALYLAEMDLDVSTPEKRAAIMERAEQVVKAGGTPNSKLVAGPWASHENPKLFWVFDSPDLTKSFPERMALFNGGLLKNLRINPIATWEETKAAAKAAEG